MTDLIDRQAAIDALITVKSCLVEEEQLFVDCLISDIERLPSAEPERKRGKWTSSQAYAEVGECYCTVCKTVYYADDLLNVGETDECGVGQALLPNYCPNCGARMVEE